MSLLMNVLGVPSLRFSGQEGQGCQEHAELKPISPPPPPSMQPFPHACLLVNIPHS